MACWSFKASFSNTSCSTSVPMAITVETAWLFRMASTPSFSPFLPVTPSVMKTKLSSALRLVWRTLSCNKTWSTQRHAGSLAGVLVLRQRQAVRQVLDEVTDLVEVLMTETLRTVQKEHQTESYQRPPSHPALDRVLQRSPVTSCSRPSPIRDPVTSCSRPSPIRDPVTSCLRTESIRDPRHRRSSMANGQLCQMISRICEDLSSGECRRLLYLCGSLDTDSCGSDNVREVLTSWLSRGRVDHLHLVELLFRLSCFDLLKKLFHISKQEVEGILGQDRALSEYRVLMSDSFLDVIVELEKLDRVSSERVELIEQCLKDISRVDLARKPQHRPVVMTHLVQPQHRPVVMTHLVQPQHRPVVMTHLVQQQWTRTPSNPMPTAFPIACHSRQEQSTQNTPENENIAEPERRRLSYQSPVEEYRLQSDPRGECLIIDCVGSDGDMLEEMFSWLHFKVTLVKWLGVGDTLSLLRQAAQQRENQDPKLFFIQTYSVSDPQDCSSRPTGHLAHREEDLETDGGGEPLSVETDGGEGYPSVESVPTDADVFWSHCWTDEGQLDEKHHQSVYLQALREAVLRGQRRRTHLVDVHTEMNGVIFNHNRRNPGARYNINLRHTLRKNLYML
ncbi:unnamed protein product [Coregonus sp. 'balchen']|nr:unnamed protein product [Coregonus sp. 'balchen']